MGSEAEAFRVSCFVARGSSVLWPGISLQHTPCKADSPPLDHQGSPCKCEIFNFTFLAIYYTFKITLLIFIISFVFLYQASQVALMVKTPPANSGNIRDVALTPGLGRSPGGGHGDPLQYSCLGNPMPEEERGGLRSLESQRVGQDWSNLACIVILLFTVLLILLFYLLIFSFFIYHL